MSRLLKASLKLHDEDSWRLPDWEEYSESGQSAWTDDARNSDAESGASDEDTSVRLPNSRAMAMGTTTTLTASKPRLLPLPIADLKALHMRFAQERQDAAKDTQQSPNEAQTEIASQLQSVREQLRDFQTQWQTRADAERESQANTSGATTTAIVSVPGGAGNGLSFDMAVQTDLAFEDDAVRQWLHLITQKMDVLATSFHHETTQLPLKYPLQSHLDRPVSFHNKEAVETESLASWHVGGELKTLVSEVSAERLLDLERSVACLATATQQTTTRYVGYFEKIIMQIQELHQQRLRQVVEESLQEMKAQRSKYKQRVEQLELECRAAKEDAAQWQLKVASTQHTNDLAKERMEMMSGSKQEQWDREREKLVAELAQVRKETSQASQDKAEADLKADDLKLQLDQMTRLLQAVEQQSSGSSVAANDANDELQQIKNSTRATIERLQSTQEDLRAELLRVEDEASQRQEEMRKEHDEAMKSTRERSEDELRVAVAEHHLEIGELKRTYESQVEELRARLEELEQETKRQMPLRDQQVQTDEDELLDGENTTDERIARLKKRCRALESLLDKKFEDSSAASVASMESSVSGSRWSKHSETNADHSDDNMASRTLPLTWSFQSSQDDTIASSHAAGFTPTRDDLSTQGRGGRYDGKWETSSNRSLRSNGSSVADLMGPSDPDAPSAEAMLALVRKLEAFATTSPSLPSPMSKQPDEEPGDLSDATTAAATPRRKDFQLKSGSLARAEVKKSAWAIAKSSPATGPSRAVAQKQPSGTRRARGDVRPEGSASQTFGFTPKQTTTPRQHPLR